jgi:hypothetical protein
MGLLIISVYHTTVKERDREREREREIEMLEEEGV